MYSLLLALIYLAFISLGLPDALLGSAWPTIYPIFNVPVSYAGWITMIVSTGTIISSLNSNRLIRKFKTGLVTAVSVLMTAIALIGFSTASSFWMLCLWAIPYGLGAGSVDSALNNYVALHYASRHMSWLHCFWGIGASIGPYIMSYSLTVKNSWETGYWTVGLFQIILTAILFISLPVWKKQRQPKNEPKTIAAKPLKIHQVFRIVGVKPVLLAFFAYCALESTTGLWASSYLVLNRGFDGKTAAGWASLFYAGITFGRIVNGFFADRLGNQTMIRIGLAILSLGLFAVLLPLNSEVLVLTGLATIGLGCAPIYPCIIHETPRNFGTENSQAIIGIQMACAYTGTTIMPPLFGWLANTFTIALYPVYLLCLLVLMFVMVEMLNRLVKRKIKAE